MTGDTTINSYYQFVIKATPSLPIVFNTIKIKFSNITGATNSQFISNYKPVIQQIKIYNSSDTQNSVRGINIISPPIIEHNKIVYTLVPYTVPTAIDTNQYLELLFYFSSLQGFTFDNKLYYEITLNNCDNLVCPVIPVDCEVSEWSDWVNSCENGIGNQKRTRSILTPAYNGGICNSLEETKSGINGVCPITYKLILTPTNKIFGNNYEVNLGTSSFSFNPMIQIKKIGIIFKNDNNITDSSYFDNSNLYSSFGGNSSKYQIYMDLNIKQGNSTNSIGFGFRQPGIIGISNQFTASNNVETFFDLSLKL
jgi:hypothetical protein